MKAILWFIAASMTACGSSNQVQVIQQDAPEPVKTPQTTQSKARPVSQPDERTLTEEEITFEKNRKLAMANLANDDADPCQGEDCEPQQRVKATQKKQKTNQTRLSKSDQEAALKELQISLRDDGPIMDGDMSKQSANTPAFQEELQSLALPAFANEDAGSRITLCLQKAGLMASNLEQLTEDLQSKTACAEIEAYLDHWAQNEGKELLDADDEGVELGISEIEYSESRVTEAFWRYRHAMQRSSQKLQTLICDELQTESDTQLTFQRIPVDLNHWLQPRRQAEALATMGKMYTHIRKLNDTAVTVSDCTRLAQVLNNWAIKSSTDFNQLDEERRMADLNLNSDTMPQVTRKPAIRIQNAYREELTRLMRRIRACQKNEEFSQATSGIFSEVQIPESLSL